MCLELPNDKSPLIVREHLMFQSNAHSCNEIHSNNNNDNNNDNN